MRLNLTNLFKKKKASQHDCEDPENCMQLLYAIIDGEATTDEKKAFDERIAKCMPCYERYQLELAIKSLIQRNTDRRKVPVELIDSIRTQTVDSIS